MKTIPFSPPDITEREIEEVVDTLKSGWITTGPKTKLFEKKIAEYCGAQRAVCLNSATAGLELVLRLFEIGPGDEVITTPYTFAATSNVILHVGATPVFVDVEKGNFNIDPENIKKAITRKTKAVIPVDFGGLPCNYDALYKALDDKKSLYRPKKGTYQTLLQRPLLMADAAHSFGASYNGKMSGNLADFTVFSFHAVKNLTTAEGGAVTFNGISGLSSEDIYKKMMLLSLHGQSKDALAKFKAGGWRYDIEIDGYKCNMTDIAASLGLVQLERFESMQKKRIAICEKYDEILSQNDKCILPVFKTDKARSCYHLYTLRIKDIDEDKRAEIIQGCAEAGISLNVHFIPLPLHPLYKKLGYKMSALPETYDAYKCEISLPVYPNLSLDDAEMIAREILKRV